MRARSLAGAGLGALALAAGAAASFDSTQQILQQPITAGTLAAASSVNAALTPGGCTTKTNFQITVTWTASATPSVSRYDVYQGTSSSGPWTLAGSTSGTSINVTGLTNWSPANTFILVRAIRNNWTSDAVSAGVAGPNKNTCK